MTDKEIQARIRAMLEGQALIPDDWRAREELVERLSPDARGALLALVWRREADPAPPGGQGAEHLAGLVDDSRRPVRVSSAAFAEGIAALIARRSRPGPVQQPGSRFTPEQARDWDIGRCLWRLISGLEDDRLSEPALAGLRDLLPLLSPGPMGDHGQRVVAARLAGLPEAAQQAVDLLLAPVEGELEAREWGLLLALPPLKLRDWVLIEDRFGAEYDPADRHAALMRFLDDLPGYPEFARQVIEAALARLEAIAQKRTAYRADGAFPLGDCTVIERAALWGLAGGRDWLLAALGPIWEMAAVAPDPKAKTMPSQSLAIRFANAAVTEPRPEALRALDAVAALCRHAGVSKKLARARRAARSALAARPERLLDLDPAQPLDKDMRKPFAAAVETLLARPEPIPAPDWLRRLGPGRKDGWALARDLIWEITPGEGGAPFTALPDKAGGWRDLDGQARAFAPSDAIRLWHPADSPDDLARHWRSLLERQGIQQPFLQAGREIYRPDPAERDGTRTALFAGREVAGRPLIGLARVSGWQMAAETELHLKLGGSRFVFDAGVRAFPGSADSGRTGDLYLAGPQRSLGQVPARVLSEALRKVDLLVTVGMRGRD